VFLPGTFLCSQNPIPASHSSQRLRWMTERPHKGSPHSFRVSKSNCLSDCLNRFIGLFNSHARSLNPQPFESFNRSLSRLGQEHSSELAGTQTRRLRHFLNRDDPAQRSLRKG